MKKKFKKKWNKKEKRTAFLNKDFTFPVIEGQEMTETIRVIHRTYETDVLKKIINEFIDNEVPFEVHWFGDKKPNLYVCSSAVGYAEYAYPILKKYHYI